MKVERVSIVRSPDSPRHVRLVAGISYLDGAREEYWFEVEEEFEHLLSPLESMAGLSAAAGDGLW